MVRVLIPKKKKKDAKTASSSVPPTSSSPRASASVPPTPSSEVIASHENLKRLHREKIVAHAAIANAGREVFAGFITPSAVADLAVAAPHVKRRRRTHAGAATVATQTPSSIQVSRGQQTCSFTIVIDAATQTPPCTILPDSGIDVETQTPHWETLPDSSSRYEHALEDAARTGREVD